MWRLRPIGARWTKVPLKTDGTPASTTDRATWTTFDQVIACYGRGGFDGIGVVLDGEPLTEDGLVLAAIDLDHVNDSSEVSARAASIVEEFGSYTETSPSGNGLRIFCLARPLRSGINGGGVEVYTNKRFLTVTGHVMEATDVRD
jgi:primase-polymerase (primpol)-like protein